MGGIAYIASAFSASELLVLFMMFPVILHISEDYEQNTIRCELQRSKSRAACYIARVLAAVTYAWGILLEYILISGITAALFFRNVPEASEASRWKNNACDSAAVYNDRSLRDVCIYVGFTDQTFGFVYDCSGSFGAVIYTRSSCPCGSV